MESSVFPGAPIRFAGSARALAWVAVIVALLLPQAGCVEQRLTPLRDVTYPPDFNYITRDELRGTMVEFARDIEALDALLTRKGGARPSDQPAVVGLLEHLHARARDLERGRDTNHPQLQDGFARFGRDIDRALNGARREPPDYVWAARLVGGCTSCHAPIRPEAA